MGQPRVARQRSQPTRLLVFLKKLTAVRELISWQSFSYLLFCLRLVQPLIAQTELDQAAFIKDGFIKQPIGQDQTASLPIQLQLNATTLNLADCFIIQIRIEGAAPAELRFRLPVLPEALAASSLIVKPITITRADSAKVGSLVEWRLEAKVVGRYSLAAIKVSYRDLESELNLPTLNIINPLDKAVSTTQPQAPSLSWESPVESLIAGQAQPFLLRLKPAAAYSSFMVLPAERLLLEKLDQTKTTADLIAIFNITALASGLLNLPQARVYLASGQLIESQELEILVLPASQKPGDSPLKAAVSNQTSLADPVGDQPAVFSIPAFPDTTAPSFIPGLQTCLALATADWQSGDPVLALARLRAYERDGLAGFWIRQIRQSADELIGLDPTDDEAAAAFWPLLGSAIIASLILVLVLIKRVTSKAFSCLALTMVFVTVLVLALSVGRLGLVRSQHRAVSKATELYRIPDKSAYPTSKLLAGTALRIQQTTAAWFYVKTSKGKAGWIPADQAIRF